ncbi:MAG: pantetheine-phosphate adenylyltransferase [Candidatus Marinimicrobia bacterium]|nr:pantetheine-phosphate adenylyltransferase [Candidatus Neomarinimicrobiota bacterium]
MRTVVYPGTFDPITNGHLDVIVRALTLFDGVTVAVAQNPSKTPLFSVDERLAMIRASTDGLGAVTVDQFSGLVVDYAEAQDACAVIRGLRAISDFEFEFQMALMNRHMKPDIATVFLMPHDRYTHLNATIIREIAGFGGDVADFVPPVVLAALQKKYSHG